MVVSNTSPIMNLTIVGQLNLLERLYGQLVIPEAVLQELLAIGTEQSEVGEIQTLPWIKTQSVTNRTLVDSLLLELHAGEAEAIVLAMELKADLLLIDERLGRKIASRLGIKFVGILGILVEAKDKGFIVAVKPILDDLIFKAGFWVSRPLYEHVLQSVGE